MPAPIRRAALSWILLAILAILWAVGPPLSQWVHERVEEGGEAAVPGWVWTVVDLLLPVWFSMPVLAVTGLALCAVTTSILAVGRKRLLGNGAARYLVVVGAVASGLAACVMGLISLPVVVGFVLSQGMCRMRTFEQADSSNGRYRARVAEIDCGAMTSHHVQVLIERRPFVWSRTSLIYFETGTLAVRWSGRTLTIVGDRARSDLVHPPPDLGLWGGVIVRYEEPAGSGPVGEAADDASDEDRSR